MISLGPAASRHRAALAQLVQSTHEFSEDERVVAIDLVDAALAGGLDYRVIVCEEGDEVLGYVCFGPTPMTEGTWDLYWIAVREQARKHGVGRRLIDQMMHELGSCGARLVRVETSGQPAYAATRAFYDRTKFEVVATIRDFYRTGDDLVVYGKYL